MTRVKNTSAMPVAFVEGSQVVVTGSNGEVDERGLHANRPAATARPAGSTYWSVNEPSLPGTVFVTDGTNWGTVEVL